MNLKKNQIPNQIKVSGNGQVGTFTLIKANGGPLVIAYFQNISKY
jgi:hypothetical protein